jgi:hypothetical protein
VDALDHRRLFDAGDALSGRAEWDDWSVPGVEQSSFEM